MARTKRKFTAEFRDNVIKLVIDGGLKASAVAKDHDLALSLVAGWVRQKRIDSGDNPRQRPTTDEREELVRLRREKRELELELTFLKKTAAYFASQKKGDSKQSRPCQPKTEMVGCAAFLVSHAARFTNGAAGKEKTRKKLVKRRIFSCNLRLHTKPAAAPMEVRGFIARLNPKE